MQVYHPYFHPILLVAAVLLILFRIDLFAYSLSERELPIDETEAQLLIEDGELDQALWSRLLPLYRRPLEVPSGELSQLAELFPELAGRLPVEQSVLDRYLPWGTKEICRFFLDYPILGRFKPLLQFDHHPARRIGAVSFYMNRSGYDTSSIHAARFLFTPVKRLRFNGTFDFTSDYARWERRSLAFDPVSWLSLRMGNTQLFPDQGLLYGYFPSEESSTSDPATNWLYGGTPGWNGCAVSCSATKKGLLVKPGIHGFIHQRTSERIVGCNITAMGKNHVSGSIGASRLSISNGDPASVYFHGSIMVRLSDFESELFYGINPQAFTGIPFSWRTEFHHENRTLELSLIRLPELFNAPRSALLRRFEQEMDLDDTLHSGVSLIQISSERKSVHPIRIVPEVELWFDEFNIDHGTLSLRSEAGWERLNTALFLSREFGINSNRRWRNIITGKLEWIVFALFSIATRHRYSFSDAGKYSYRGTIAPVLVLFSSIRLEPSVTFQIKESGTTSLLAGCRQKMTLFDRTFTEFIFERDFTIPSLGNGLRVEGRASFFF